MSGTTSFLNQLLDIPSPEKIKADHQISLVDRTKPADEPVSSGDGEEAERNDSEATDVLPTPSTGPELFKRLTKTPSSLQQSVRQQIARQKYARYSQDQYHFHHDNPPPPDEDSANAPQPGEAASAQQTSYLERGRAKAQSMLKRKRTIGKASQEDTIIDILYENQRGFFFFGIPHYSTASLLPSDPKPWQNAQFRTSPVDIRNAQVPDPSWRWVWKSWYVDMSRDVDEEGWEYSLMFKANASWHGNHPWFHSFVRRRRWLRMRRRNAATRTVTKGGSHELTAEYFTIHPATLKPSSDDLSKARSSEMARVLARMQDEPDISKMDITDIGSLVAALRKASVDREKLVAVRKFVANGGDELYYLSERMPEIMSLLIYQSSRRQLLGELIAHHESAHERRESLKQHEHLDGDDQKQKEHDDAVRHAEYLHNAVKAADAQVKRLEYWSDIKGMANEEGVIDTERFKDLAAGGHPQQAFASKQAPEEGAPNLHSHPEHVDESGPKGEQSPPSIRSPPSKRSSAWFDAQTSPRTDSSRDSNELDRYTTANESLASDYSTSLPKSAMGSRDKGKGRAISGKVSNLDGVNEEAAEVPSSGGRDDHLDIVLPKSVEDDE